MSEDSQREPGWPRVSLPPESVAALRPLILRDGSRATSRDGRKLWLVYAVAPEGTHLGATDIGGRALRSIARPGQVIGLKDGTARLEDGVDRVTLSFKPGAPLATYEVTRDDSGNVALSAESHGPQDARALWALVSSVKARREGAAQPATDRQLARIRALDPQAGPGVDTMSKAEASAYIDSLTSGGREADDGSPAVGEEVAAARPRDLERGKPPAAEGLEGLLAAGSYDEAWSLLESSGLMDALSAMLNERVASAWGRLPAGLDPAAKARASLSQAGIDVSSLAAMYRGRPPRGVGRDAGVPEVPKLDGHAMAKLISERRYGEASKLLADSRKAAAQGPDGDLGSPASEGGR